ncbi:MAG: hypothetical protein V4560_17180 [Bacteroidota bacterium]
MQDRSVILLATNQKKYLDFALNCAESIKLHNPGLPIFIATNIITDKEYRGVKFVPVSDEVAKLTIAAKIYLDQLIQTEETLFIDSDCLCYGNLDLIFNTCAGHNVTTVGRLISRGEEWGPKSAEHGMKNFGTDKFIIYNGGLYYIRKSDITNRIFEKARELYRKYDYYEFGRIKNGWVNEEQVFAIAMVLNNETPVADNGLLITDLYTDKRPRKLNVLTGNRLLRNFTYPLTEPRSWYPAVFSPVVLHFGGDAIRSYPYISQVLLLKLNKIGYPVVLSSVIKYLLMDISFKTYHFIRRYANF